jgi:hypothetical protein
MLYEIKPEIKITKEFILHHVKPEDIFLRYLGSGISFTESFKLPYRAEKTPSTKFFIGDDGILRFKDFGSGQTLDCFGVVMFINRCNYPTALETVAHDFGLTSDYSGSVIPINWTVSSTVVQPKTETIIEVKRKAFTTPELAWWNSYYISPAILKHYEVQSLSNFWINDRMLTADGNHLFGYDLGIDDKGIKRWKIYRPLQPKGLKWFSNTRASNIQGWKQLPKTGDLVIITSSMKDLMCLRALGYPAIAFQSEVCTFDESIITQLKERFKRQLILLDSDTTGIQSAKDNSDKFGIPFIYIPTQLNQKDPSDLLKAKREEGIKLIKQLIQ